ncbi:MAG: DUF3592 domain-containing protein [Candidatus Aureabacteria bacterium]|nr:DUF3592 domain-containing protein [Candidatus Auribacterota bacterium]
MKRNSNWVLVMIVATGIAASGFVDSQHAFESRNWPVTRGMIVSSQIERTSKRKKENGQYVLKTKFNAKITYAYQLNGLAYSSSRISFSDPKSLPHEEAVRLTTTVYPKGKEVEVYFNPKDHNISTLVPGMSRKSVLSFLISLMPLIFSLLYYMKNKKKILG